MLGNPRELRVICLLLEVGEKRVREGGFRVAE